MSNRSSKFFALVLSVIGLCGIPACGFLGIGNGNDNTNTNTNDNGNDNANTNDNANGNDNGDESDFALFTDPDSDFSTTDVRDIDGETIKFRLSNQAIVYQDGREFQEGSWPVTGNFVGGTSFQVRFGTEDGVRQAYFTEAAPGTICDYIVTETTFSIAPTSQTPPQE